MKSLCIHSLVILLLQTRVKSQGPCGERNVTGAVGGAATLQVTHIGTRTIYWTFGEGYMIAITKPGGSLEIQDPQYNGRLSGSSDGSLTISNLQHEEQGTYRAQIIKELWQNCFYDLSVFRNLTDEDITIGSNVTDNMTCEMILTCSVNSTKKSNVTVTWRRENSRDISPTENVTVPPCHNNFTYICTANNPVSMASKSVSPREYCQNGFNCETKAPKADYRMVNVIRLGISGCVLLITCCIFIHHMKTEVITQRPETDSI